MFLNDKYNNDIENKKRGSCFVQLEDKALFGTALAAFGSITCAGHAPGGTIAGTVTSLDVDLNFLFRSALAAGLAISHSFKGAARDLVRL